MIDVQSRKDGRNVYLNEVGIRNIVFPMEIMRRDGKWQMTNVNIGMGVDLPSDQKGTHMSRFVDVLHRNARINLQDMKNVLAEIRRELGSAKSFIDLSFPYFIIKEAPVTGKQSLLDVAVRFTARYGETFDFEMQVRTPVTTLCPCSKEISTYSAHNQRAEVSILIGTVQRVWIEDLVEIAEQSASAPVYPLLKRPDEKFVTEQAYENPRFVEDVCREVKLALDRRFRPRRYEITVESFESIHNHSAFARVCGGAAVAEEV